MYCGIVAATFKWGSSEMQATLTGAAIPILQQSYQYFFGSSSSGDRKDQVIAEQGDKLVAITQAPSSGR